MEPEAAKLIGAGIACIALAGAGIGIGTIFGNYLAEDYGIIYGNDDPNSAGFWNDTHSSGSSFYSGIVEIKVGGVIENEATLTVNPVNDAPQLTGEQYSFADSPQGEAIFISQDQLLQGYTDAEGDRLQISELDITKLGGTLSFQSNPDGWLFTPDQNFIGNLDFS